MIYSHQFTFISFPQKKKKKSKKKFEFFKIEKKIGSILKKPQNYIKDIVKKLKWIEKFTLKKNIALEKSLFLSISHDNETFLGRYEK